MIPGVATATEVIAALDYGLEVLKLFPAEAVGGVRHAEGARRPVSRGPVRARPEGSARPTSARYLALPNVAAVGGSWMVAPELVAAGDFDAIERLTAEAVALAAEAVR